MNYSERSRLVLVRAAGLPPRDHEEEEGLSEVELSLELSAIGRTNLTNLHQNFESYQTGNRIFYYTDYQLASGRTVTLDFTISSVQTQFVTDETTGDQTFYYSRILTIVDYGCQYRSTSEGQ